MRRKVILLITMGLIAMIFAGCSSSDSAATFASDEKAALLAVPNVVDATAQYKNNPGMGSSIIVRVTAKADADLKTVLESSLKAFAGAVGSVKKSSAVHFYVFPQGNEDGGIRPDSVGLDQAPSVTAIGDYAKNN